MSPSSSSYSEPQSAEPGGVAGQILDGLDLAGGLLQVLEHLAVGVDRIDRAVEQGGLERPEGEVVLVVSSQPQLAGAGFEPATSGL
jgi:hypothetical protein